MKKLLVLVVILGLLASLPAVVGFLAQRDVEQGLAQLSERYPGVELELVSYSRRC